MRFCCCCWLVWLIGLGTLFSLLCLLRCVCVGVGVLLCIVYRLSGKERYASWLEIWFPLSGRASTGEEIPGPFGSICFVRSPESATEFQPQYELNWNFCSSGFISDHCYTRAAPYPKAPFGLHCPSSAGPLIVLQHYPTTHRITISDPY